MSERDRRLVLEEIAYSSDPSVTAGDRLRALELLDALEESESEPEDESDFEYLSDEERLAEIDAYQAKIVVEILEGDEDLAFAYPVTAAALRSALEERAQEFAAGGAPSGL